MRGSGCPVDPGTVSEGMCHWAREIWGPEARWIQTPCPLPSWCAHTVPWLPSFLRCHTYSQGQWYHWVMFIAVTAASRTTAPLWSGLFQSESSQEGASDCSGSCSPKVGLSAGVWEQVSFGSYLSSAANARWLYALCADFPTKTQLFA